MDEGFDGGEGEAVDCAVYGALECFPCLSLDVDGCYFVGF